MTAAMAKTIGRQPPRSAMAAMPGKKIRDPVALAAIRRPVIRPRWVTTND